jgi:DNA-binding FrmR family transcriptional regulator
MTKTTEQLISNVIGQLEGIKKMLSEDRDCVSVLTQMKAANSALDSVLAKYIKDNLYTCVNSGNPEDKVLMDSLVKELVKN